MKKRIFINSTLAPLMAQKFNAELVEIVRAEGFEVYLPQEAMPPGSNIASAEIFKENLKAIERCDIVISVLDHAGLGVALELGYAVAKGKVILAFRSDLQSYLGKVLQGFWNSLEKAKKAKNFDELKVILHNLHSRPGS